MEQILVSNRTRNTQTEISERTHSRNHQLQRNFKFTQRLTTVDNKEFDINKNYYSKSECTSIFFGLEPITQLCFTCYICSPTHNNKMCKYCYENCHKECHDNLEKKSPELLQLEKHPAQEFACYCGIRQKHFQNEFIEKETISCNLIQLDRILQIEKNYCVDHQINICSICTVICHTKCHLVEKEETEEICCGCQSEYHTEYNEIVLMLPIERYREMFNIHLHEIQVLNIFFYNKIFNKIATLFNNEFNFYQNIDKNSEAFEEHIIFKHHDDFNHILGLFSGILNKDFKMYYYNEFFLELFNYEQIINYMKKTQSKNSQVVVNKLRLLIILFKVHLKRDFQLIKSLTSIDFLTSSIISRLKYKLYLNENNIITEHINNKYELYGNFPLKKFLLEEINFLFLKGIKFASLEDYSSEYENILQIILFLLKFYLLNKKDLILLIRILENFHDKIYDFITANSKNIYNVINVFACLIKIIFIICIEYNDIVCEEYLNGFYIGNFNSNKIKGFVHQEDEFTGTLFKITLKNCIILSKHYNLLKIPKKFAKNSVEEANRENEILFHRLLFQKVIRDHKERVKFPENSGIFSEKIISLFNNTLELFSLADNIYQKQLLSFSSKDLEEYHYLKKHSLLKKDFYKIIYMSEQKYDSNISYHLKVSLERAFLGLFSSTFNEIDYKKFINQIKSRIMNAIDLIYENLERLYPKNLEKKEENDAEKKQKIQKTTKSKKDNFNRNLFHILHSLKFLRHQMIKNPKNGKENFNNLLKCLMFTCIDETILKCLSFIYDNKFPKILEEELIKLCFDFLSIFLFTKEGIEYLILGRTLQRIVKIFKYVSFRKTELIEDEEEQIFIVHCSKIVFEFLYKLFEGSKNYNISFRNHTALRKIHKRIIKHLKCFIFNGGSEENEIELKNQILLSLKIFSLLSEDFEEKFLEGIKSDFFYLLSNERFNFLLGENFIKCFSLKTKENEETNPIHLNEYEKKIKKIEIDVYFSFFSFIFKNNFYIYEEDKKKLSYFDLLKHFVDLDFMLKLLRDENEISIDQKKILLKFLRGIYFTDILNQTSYRKKYHHLTSKEYKGLLLSGNIKKIEILQYISQQKKILDKNISKELFLKYEDLSVLEKMIKIFIFEISNFYKFIEEEQPEEILEYIYELIFGVKQISEFFYEEKFICHKLTIHFFNICLKFLSMKNSIIKLILDIQKNSLNFTDYRFVDEESTKELKKQSFNIFDIQLIYSFITEAMNDIFIKTGIHKKYNLENFFKNYDEVSESNFTPFSLIETKDFEYFYEKNEEKKENLTSEEYEIKNLNNAYIEQFILISNTNFLSIITNIQNGPQNIDLRNNLVIYFQSFLNSKESRNFSKFRSILCIITKLLFYDSENTQPKFHQMITDKDFFVNFNKQLNIGVVLSISSSRNWEVNSIAKKYIDITKLIIKFLQALGEGFNSDYHRNIFLTNQLSEQYSDFNEKKHKDNFGDVITDQKLIEDAASQQLKRITVEKVEIDAEIIDISIYQSIIENLKLCYLLIDLKNPIDAEMPFDKVCILICNFIDFVIEYIQSSKEINESIDQNFRFLFFGTRHKGSNQEYSKEFYSEGAIYLLKTKIFEVDTKEYKLRKKLLSFVKIKFLSLIIAYLQTGGKRPFIDKLIDLKYGPIELFNEINYYFEELLYSIRNTKIQTIHNVSQVDTYKKILQSFYIFNENFREGIELQVILNYYILIKIFEEIYGLGIVNQHFEQMKEKLINLEQIESIKNEERIAYQIQQDLKEKKERKKLNSYTKKNEDEITPYEKIMSTYGNQISGNLNFSNKVNLSTRINEVKIKENQEEPKNKNFIDKDKFETALEEQSRDLINLTYFKFLESIVLRVEIKTDFTEKRTITDKAASIEIIEKIKNYSKDNNSSQKDKENNSLIPNQKTFFIRPYLTFFISKQSVKYFEENVDRTNATSKFFDLMTYTDYFSFEMVLNRRLIGQNKFLSLVSDIRFYLLELFSFLFIIIQNISTIIHYYKKPSLSANEYEVLSQDLISEVFIDNYIVAFTHFVYIGLCLLLWFYLKFILCFQKNIMLTYHNNFIFRKNGLISQNLTNPKIINLFKGNQSIFSVMNEINKNIGFLNLAYTCLFDTILFNREICFFIYTLILNILYLLTNETIWIVIPTLFIVNLSPTLFDIIKAFKLRFSSFLLLLMFTFLFVYVFMWFTFYFLRDEFEFDDILEVESGQTITESFCKSTVQCFFFILSEGMRAGGGIGDALPVVSFYTDVPFFFLRFFYDILFHILIVWILLNFFSGVIIDTFAELRDINWNRENDMKNKCFICQMSRDDCLKKNIDFNDHITKEHNLWDYVYFLIYLHLSSSNDFNRIENNVWEKLLSQDFSWVPINVEEDNEDEE